MSYFVIGNNCDATLIQSYIENIDSYILEYKTPFVSSLFPNDAQFVKFCYSYDYYTSLTPNVRPLDEEPKTPRPLPRLYPIMYLEDIEIHWPYATMISGVLDHYGKRLENGIGHEPIFLFSLGHTYTTISDIEVDKIVYDFMRTKHKSIMLSPRKKDMFEDANHLCHYIKDWEGSGFSTRNIYGVLDWGNYNVKNIFHGLIDKKFLKEHPPLTEFEEFLP